MGSKATGGVGAPSRRYNVDHPCHKELRQIRRGGSVCFDSIYSICHVRGWWKEQSAAGVTDNLYCSGWDTAWSYSLFQFQYLNPVSALVCCADWFKWRLHGEKSESTGGARAPRRRYTVYHPCRCCQKELRQLPRGSSIRFCPVYGQWKEHSAVGVTCDGLGILE